MVSSVNGRLFDESSSKRCTENGRHCSSNPSGPYKYKPRKVSAVRDFPPGCGRNSLHVDFTANDAPSAVHLAESYDVESPITEGIYGGEMSTNFHFMDTRVFSKELQKSDGSTSIGSVGSEEKKTVLEIGPLAGKATPATGGTGVKLWSPPNWPLGYVNSSDETLPTNINHGRRIPVTRDFPPFCGRNAHPPSEEDLLKIMSRIKNLGELGKSGQENDEVPDRAGLGVTSGTFKETLQVSEVVLKDGNSVNIEMEGIIPFNSTNKSHKGRIHAIRDFPPFCGRNAPPPSNEIHLRFKPGIKNSSGMEKSSRWKGALTFSDGGLARKIVKQQQVITKKEKSAVLIRSKGRKPLKETPAYASAVADGNAGVLIPANDEEQSEHCYSGLEECNFDVILPQFGSNSTSHGVARTQVIETIRKYRANFMKLLQTESASTMQREATSKKKIHLKAAEMTKDEVITVNTRIGAIPGVEIGDEFIYKVELALVGIHRTHLAGIDYTNERGKSIALSVVASREYADDLTNPDKLIYIGSGGKVVGKNQQTEDQRLKGGNLALKNSICEKNSVRVIRGFEEAKASMGGRAKMTRTFVYDGLYKVTRYWTETSSNGKLVYMFELIRIPGQPKLVWLGVNNSKKI